MRRAAKIDANQREVVKALRAIGCTVAITSSLGDGFPDLVVGYRGRNYLIEVKDGNKPPSRRKLTKDEKQFSESWKGQYAVVESIDEAIGLVNK